MSHQIRILMLLAAAVHSSAAAICYASDAADESVSIQPDVVYGHKYGLAMTMDVVTPVKEPNRGAILFMVSGGWYSNWAPPEKMLPFYRSLTDHGFTVFLVRHGSSPKFSIPEAVSDVRRAVRFVRLNADRFQIDSERIGVYGMSAGGHLSLVLGTTADSGTPSESDPVEAVSDRVQAVVAFVAPTDLTIMVRGAADRLPAYDRFPALDLEMAEAEKFSPLKHVSPDDAPTLLLAGDRDDLVPVDHSRKIHEALKGQNVASELVEFSGAGHGFNADQMRQAQEKMVQWFRKNLIDNVSEDRTSVQK
jgi:acetyl esterase/lipase